MDYCFLDTETTGLDPYEDRIVEIKLARVDEDGEPVASLTTRMNPGVPIPPSATEVHGITSAHVIDLPPFGEYAQEIQRLVDGACLVGFGSRRFDVPLIDAELRRAGEKGLARDADGMIDVPEIDLYLVWVRSERRSLEDAVERFAGQKLDDAHSAEADADALYPVMTGMLRAFDLDVEKMLVVTRPDDEVDRDGKFVKRESDGKIVFNFGQHRGKPVARNPDYLRWMLSKDFSPEVDAWCRKFLAQLGPER